MLGDFSPAGAERSAELARETLAQLEAAAVDDERDLIARDALAERLRLDLELHEAGEHLRSLNIMGSALQRIRGTFDLIPREGEQAWANIASRLDSVPEALAGYRQRLNEGLERGLAASARQTRETADQVAVWSGQRAGQPPFFDSLVQAHEDAGSPGGQTMHRSLEQGARAAGDAYADAGR